ncbi:unnamed protein product [Bemisia tabaci]|uniref:Uncharacterized protein n=1 Tax=Bemisia tabaci TaxID=7038 RepID=A0A9P0EY48_BEMTA|nr:unnamed protein product [Bemisia tabaci]
MGLKSTPFQVLHIGSLSQAKLIHNPEAGVPDMTTISNLDEKGINRNLQVRYLKDQIYVSFFQPFCTYKSDSSFKVEDFKPANRSSSTPSVLMFLATVEVIFPRTVGSSFFEIASSTNDSTF